MKFLVSYKVEKRHDINDIIVENIDSMVLDTSSTKQYSFTYDNVVNEKVLEKWGGDICKKERFDNGYEYTILKYSILTFCKLGPY